MIRLGITYKYILLTLNMQPFVEWALSGISLEFLTDIFIRFSTRNLCHVLHCLHALGRSICRPPSFRCPLCAVKLDYKQTVALPQRTLSMIDILNLYRQTPKFLVLVFQTPTSFINSSITTYTHSIMSDSSRHLQIKEAIRMSPYIVVF
jgi:hypothetical protein